MSKINNPNKGKEKYPHEAETKDYTPEAGTFEEPNIEEVDDIDWDAFRKDIIELLKEDGLM
ncbi:MAG: hypothetical protein HC913_05250 [Microscillaceae bacterium]|nr:hypothetical protein [Microscillaceae bacterium]